MDMCSEMDFAQEGIAAMTQYSRLAVKAGAWKGMILIKPYLSLNVFLNAFQEDSR